MRWLVYERFNPILFLVNPKVKDIRGFALLEVLITMLIFGAGALSLLAIQTKLIRATALSSQSNEAIILAQEKMEQMRHFGTLSVYNTLADGNDTTNRKTTTFNRAWKVAATTDPLYKNIEITVGWTTSQGESQSVKIASIIAGLNPIDTGRAVSLYQTVVP